MLMKTLKIINKIYKEKMIIVRSPLRISICVEVQIFHLTIEK